MDFNGLLILGFVWLLVNLLGRAKGNSRPRPRTAPQPPPGRRSAPHPPGPADVDPTQREGSQLERLLRQLERNLDEVGGVRSRPAAVPLPSAEEVEERTSLEQPEQVVSLETEVVRQPRVRVDYDEAAEGVEQRRVAAAAARSGKLTRADHARFDEQI
ncbi:MAG TPA: hypothetical protein VG500_00970, partial [Gemmatimonadales bacterium]|nr:hypothetical protein [Gemmatimonadales bacterium]